LTFAELIRSGATSALDMGTVRHTDEVFESAARCGFRLTSGKAMMDAGEGVPAGLLEVTSISVQESLRLSRQWHGAQSGRLRYAFAPRFALSCSEELLREVSVQARSLGVRIHSHASENSRECEAVRAQTGHDNVAYFHSLGLTGQDVTLAHCVWLTAEEQKLLANTHTAVCHCPSANLKLASGVAKVPELLKGGVAVALGADGAACNNNLDMFIEMRLAALIHNPRDGAFCMPAMTVLRMATMGGASALGQSRQLGSIEEGKLADLAILDFASAAHASLRGQDVAAQIVYSGKASDVRHVVIDGQIVMKDRCLLTLDHEETVARAATQARALARRI
jgi:cytosine/adenosine deaminase-related metal-dependent hydrolase